ncbi:MAG: response regulator [Rhodanobacter sp.]|nr:MAG: response regulator [Rhodanobacter sp.]TAM11719.1 MAG: response regulator [Rhodanobacter sp.]TAM36122.1 MAG: response regulator [Rhodanobacter sp.]
MAVDIVTPPSTAPWQPALRVLIADDDAASCRFLGDAMAALGAAVTTCADGAGAVHWAQTERFDLLLLDCRMPVAGALDVLARLQADPHARSGHAVAVASTAEPEAATRTRLLAAGFHAVLPKPCGMAQLRNLMLLVPGASPLLDNAAAVRATGNAATMQALRTLLRHELQALQRDLAALATQRNAFGERLHRLRSSCGFCGTPALAAAVARLQQRVQASATINPATLDAFDAAVTATLDALQPE